MIRLPKLSRDAWLLNLTTALLASGFLGMMPLLKVIYMLRLGYGPEYVGTVFASGALSFTLFSVPGGALGGRFGPRRLMIVGAVINVVGMALLPLTEALPASLQAFWPAVVQIVSSGGWSVVMVNHVSALMALTTPENRRQAYALREAMSGLGMLLGALVGGLLPGAFAGLLGTTTDQPTPYRYALLVAVVIGLTALLPLRRIPRLPGVMPSRAQRGGSLPLAPLAVLVVCAFLNQGAVASCKAFASAYMDVAFDMPTSLIGTISSVGMFLAAVAALSTSRLSQNRGGSFVMMVASLALGLSQLQMGLWPHPAAAGLGLVGMFALAAMWVPAYQVLQMEMVGPEWRSLVAGAGSMAMSLGFGMVSFGGGYVIAALGYRQVFLIGAAMALLSGVLLWISRLSVRGARQEQAEHIPVP